MKSLPLDLELPNDSPTWGEPVVDQDTLDAWRMQATLWERENGQVRERDAPNPIPFIWKD